MQQMASSNILVLVAMAAVFVPSVLAAEYVVGDGKGWTLNFDYQAWAEGKEFHVGDKLVFNYPQGKHNVHRVDETAFQQCKASAGDEALTTGNDAIELSSPGRKWYICGVSNHCESGNMKLSITVLPQVGSPAASPTSIPGTESAAASSRIATTYYAWILGIMVAVLGFVMI